MMVVVLVGKGERKEGNEGSREIDGGGGERGEGQRGESDKVRGGGGERESGG